MNFFFFFTLDIKKKGTFNLKSVFGGRHLKTNFYQIFGIIKNIREIKIY